MLNENACHRKVLVERLIKMSYMFEVEQKNFKQIDVFREYMRLGNYYEPINGYYNDSEFIKRIKQYEYELQGF